MAKRDPVQPKLSDALGQQQFRATRREVVLHLSVAQQEFHTLDEQARVEALLGKVVGPGCVGVADGREVVAPCQHQDRQQAAVGSLANRATGIDTRQLGHLDVKDGHVWEVVLDDVLGLCPVT